MRHAALAALPMVDDAAESWCHQATYQGMLGVSSAML